jgi:hypothetical protein
MTDKPITITLAWYIRDYKVAAITNTTKYKPGEWLSPAAVQALCDLPGWTVVITDNQLLQTITGIAMDAAEKSIVP